MSYRNYATATGFIVDPNGFGDFTTIGSALTASTSGTTIFIRPGTYTENPTLKAGVNLTAFMCDPYNPTVTILGKCTATFAGSCSISGIQLKTNSDFCLAVTGSSATNIYLKGCQIDANNNTAISFTSSSGNSFIYIFDCQGLIDTTGIAYFSHSSAGVLRIFGGYWSNGGGSSTTSTVSGTGALELRCQYFNNAITTSSTAGFLMANTEYHGPLTINSTVSGSNSIGNSSVDGGSSSAITLGAGATATVFNVSISSSNTNAIAGTGTYKYGLTVYTNTSSTIAAGITQTALTTH